jgi:hypothetical protein
MVTADGWNGSPASTPYPLRAQNLASLGGKVLRVTPEREGLPDNPFWTGDVGTTAPRFGPTGFGTPFASTWARTVDRVSATSAGTRGRRSSSPPAGEPRLACFGDWSRSWLRSARVAPDGRLLTHDPADFATHTAGPVQIENGPDGTLYYLAANAGEIRRIRVG